MKSKCSIILTCLLLTTLLACNEVEVLFKNNGSLTYNGNTVAINTARALLTEKVDETNHQISLMFYSPTLTINEISTKGYGNILTLIVQTDSIAPKPGEYLINGDDSHLLIADSSFLAIIPETTTDTTLVKIANGSLKIEESPNGLLFTWKLTTTNNETIDGKYEGSYTYNVMIDGDKVGELSIGTSTYNLQQGEIIAWGNMFNEAANYYELYFYSTDIRYTDAGKISKGLMFVIGLHSNNPTSPNSGNYPLSRQYIDQTALIGSKLGNSNWGTYWYDYITSSAPNKAFVTKDSIQVATSTNGTFRIDFNCTDQLGNPIKGYYEAPFKPITMPTKSN